MGKKKKPDWTGLKGDGLGQCCWRLGNSSIEFDERTLELWRAGVVVAVEAKPLYVLMALVRHPHRLVLKSDLIRWIWHNRENSEGVLAKAVTKLRIALGDSEQELIQTAHGMGYRLALEPVRLDLFH